MLDNGLVFNKTPLGTDEILRRAVGLPNDLRSLLLLIDGRRDVVSLRNISVALRESLAPLMFLEDNGFIVRMVAESSVVPLQKRAMAAGTPAFAQNAVRPMAAGQPTPIPTAASAVLSSVLQNYAQTPTPPAYALNEVRGALIQFVSSALGADGAHAIGRIQNAVDLAELQSIARRIYEVLKDYSGVRTAEKFMQQFEGPLKL
jgi:hypothetical protein